MTTSKREQLIDKLADEMDRDNARAFVDAVIQEALMEARAAAAAKDRPSRAERSDQH